MIKTNLLAIALIFLTACASSVPTKTKDALSAITVSYDKFDKSTSIETPIYLSSTGLIDEFPINLKFRAVYNGTKLSFIQLYLINRSNEWSDYYRAVGEDGKELTLSIIDKVVDASTFKSMVLTEEHVGLSISMDYLELMSNSDFSIKLYGKRRSGDFIVPSSLTEAFLQKLNCFETNTCI
jgi:hypothetical protein